MIGNNGDKRQPKSLIGDQEGRYWTLVNSTLTAVSTCADKDGGGCSELNNGRLPTQLHREDRLLSYMQDAEVEVPFLPLPPPPSCDVNLKKAYSKRKKYLS